MGEVWRAWHRDQRLPIAMKVLTGVHARNPRYVRSFQNEVRAVASLDHPHIVMLLDVGIVDEAAAQASRGHLVAGSPWLAMEYASGGTLRDHSPTSWSEVRRLLLQILDALAHAHARGIVHRDLKPANILFCRERDPRPGLKLTDFGIAARTGEADASELGAGTPAYMAPEQLMGDLPDLGPWTDLYSLGCLAWRMITGKVPFDGLKRMPLVRAHLSAPPPPFVPRMDTPAGLEGWLRALLTKRHEDRPQRAADAAAVLASLSSIAGARDSEPTDDTDVSEHTTIGALFTGDLDSSEVPTRVGRSVRAPGRIADWRTSIPRPPPVLIGAGLGLFGLREPPLMGRAEQQEALWAELRAVHRSAKPRVVRISGSTGVGKTRLASWLCRRADELGAARFLWISHASEEDDSGLLTMVRLLVRGDGVPVDELQERLRVFLGDVDTAGNVAALLAGDLDAAAARETSAQLVGRVAQERPIILVIDDAQWAGDLLQLAAALLERGDRVLVCVIDQDEAIAGRAEATGLESLGGLHLPLGPLDPAAQRGLVQALLGLHDDLATQVEARSGGNPQFAVQLIGDWVARGLLWVGQRGFELAGDPVAASLPIPDDLHAVWAQRIRRVLEGLPRAATLELEVAAALGSEVEDWAWQAACTELEGSATTEGAARRTEIVDRLLRARLATPRDDGWAFSHGMFRESIIRQSRERGAWRRANRVAAVALRARGEERGRAERIGRLLVEAGMEELAIRPLIRGVRELLATNVRGALAILTTAEAAARTARLPGSSPQSGALLVSRARIHAALDQHTDALRWAHWAQDAARNHHRDPTDRAAVRRRDPWTVHFRDALRIELSVHVTRRDVPSARRAFRMLSPTIHVLNEPALLADLLTAQAGLLGAEPDRADELLIQAVVALEKIEAHVPIARVLVHRAAIATEQGELHQARELLVNALERLGANGPRQAVGVALGALAEVHLQLKDVAEATKTAGRAVRVLDGLGNPASKARIILGLALSEEGDHEAAQVQLVRALSATNDRGRRDLLPIAAIGAALVAARLSHWSSVHDRLRDAERACERTPCRHHARSVAEQLAQVAKIAGLPQLAARAGALASAHSVSGPT